MGKTGRQGGTCERAAGRDEAGVERRGRPDAGGDCGRLAIAFNAALEQPDSRRGILPPVLAHRENWAKRLPLAGVRRLLADRGNGAKRLPLAGVRPERWVWCLLRERAKWAQRQSLCWRPSA